MTQRMSDEIITVRDYSGTHISRFRGKTASCTSGRRAAAEAVARKVMGATPFIIEMCGNEYAWKVVSTNDAAEARRKENA